jgi:hypothetical protein
MRYLKQILVFVSLLSVITFAPLAYADDSQLFSACNANAQTKTSPVCQDQGTTKNPVNHLIHVTADIIAVVTGIAAVVVIILGGLTMATSGGNTEAVANARRRVLYSLVGLVVVALAWTILTFLTNKLIKT